MDFSKIGLTINQLIRYGYGGFLLLACLIITGIFQKEMISSIIDSGFLVLFGTYALGLVIYIFYRSFLGEYIIWPLFEWIHRHTDEFWAVGKISSCKRIYLEHNFGVAHANSIDAYRLIRNKRGELKDRFQEVHTEIHLLYITSVVLFPFSIYEMAKHSCSFGTLLELLYKLFFMPFGIWLFFISLAFYYLVIYRFALDISNHYRDFNTSNSIIPTIKFRSHPWIMSIIFFLILYVLGLFLILLLINYGSTVCSQCLIPFILFILSLLTLFVGMIGDIDICRRECSCLKSIPDEKIRELLRVSRYI